MQKLFYITITLATLGILISQIMFIPTWEDRHAILTISVFLLSLILGIVYLVKLWRLNYKSKHSLRLIDWVKSIAISVIIIGGIPLLFILSIFTIGHGVFGGPLLAKEITLGGEKIYLYHRDCFPDDACGCDYYYSLVYRKNTHLPIMHFLTKVDFYADDARLNKKELTISSSNVCLGDRNKVKKIKL